MLISFPFIENSWIVQKSFFETFGCNVVVPPKTNKRTIELGVKYSPEMACFPFKVTLGQMIEAVEMGADTILMTIGKNRMCRLPFYLSLQEEILKNLGYKFNIVSIDLHKIGLFRLFSDVLRKMLAPNSRAYYFTLIKAVRISWTKMALLEEIEYLTRTVRPFEINVGEATRVRETALKLISNSKTERELRFDRRKIHFLFNKITKDLERDILRIALAGEIFVCSDSFVNRNIERKLGEWGTLVLQPYSTNYFVKTALGINFERKYVAWMAKDYLPVSSGGEDQQTIGKIVISAQKDYDGIILIYPFGCMPENNAQAIIPYLQKKLGIPVLNLCIDEYTSDLGIENRLEAFIDMLRARRKRNGTSVWMSG